MKKLVITMILSMLMVMVLVGQVVVDTTGNIIQDGKGILDAIKQITSWEDIVSLYTVAFAFLWTVIGYLQELIPWFKVIDKTWVRVFVIGLMIVGAVVFIGGYSWIAAAAGWVVSTGAYKFILKKIFPTKETAEAIKTQSMAPLKK